MKSWKTSLAGIGTLLASIGLLFTDISQGKTDLNTLAAPIGAIATGIGLLFARDHSVSDESAGVAPTQSAAGSPPSNVLKQASIIAILFGASVLVWTACSTIDPALPGQTKPAPLLAFTNGQAYILGHVATSNQVYSATLTATTLGVQLLEKDSPGASNYLSAAQAVVSSVASGGSFNSTNLQTALNNIPLQNSTDGPLINSLASTTLSLAGIYVQPLISSDTNSAPYVEAALWGLANGL